jgi:hypothetical protein
MAREPTEAELVQAEREIMEWRGQRVIDARKAAEEAAKAPGARKLAELSGLKEADFLGAGPPELTARQIAETATAYRANYSRYDDPEIVALLEERLAAAFKADGYSLPPMPAEDRLKMLLRRAAKGN